MGLDDYTPYQQKLIKRYYQNHEAIQLQRLSELVTELYLAEGKKREKLWASIGVILEKLEIPHRRREHLLTAQQPELLAKLVQELHGQGS